MNEHYPYGMAATMRVKLFAEFLVNHHHHVNILISNQDNGDNAKSGINNGVKYSTLYKVKKPVLVYLLVYPFIVFYKLLLLKQKNIMNILIIYSGVNLFNLQFMIFGKLLGYKIVIDAVEDNISSSEEMKILSRLNIKITEMILPYIGKFIDGVTVISMKLLEKYQLLYKDHQIKLLPISAANINLIYKKSTKNAKLKFVYAGSYGKKDGVTILIDAFNILSKKYPEIQLLLLGKITTGLSERIQLLKNINIIQLGYLDEKNYWINLSEADILCMTRIDSPYANAGFPFKLGEYLATRNPVIVTDISDVKDYLTDKKDCLMAKPSDKGSLIDAMEYLIENPEVRELIGNNGYEKCIQFFNPEINGKILLNYLLNISK
jgi:glycosyltransferase involved in cell wall biosynthesis